MSFFLHPQDITSITFVLSSEEDKERYLRLVPQVMRDFAVDHEDCRDGVSCGWLVVCTDDGVDIGTLNGRFKKNLREYEKEADSKYRGRFKEISELFELT